MVVCLRGKQRGNVCIPHASGTWAGSLSVNELCWPALHAGPARLLLLATPMISHTSAPGSLDGTGAGRGRRGEESMWFETDSSQSKSGNWVTWSSYSPPPASLLSPGKPGDAARPDASHTERRPWTHTPCVQSPPLPFVLGWIFFPPSVASAQFLALWKPVGFQSYKTYVSINRKTDQKSQAGGECNFKV